MKKKGLSVFETASFSLGSLAREISNACVNSFIIIYLSVYVGLNPLVVTVAFVAARLWDAVNDPLLAAMVNNSKASKRFGRYKPWILFGLLANIAFTVLMFVSVDTSVTVKYIYYIGIYVLWGMSYTVFDVPFWSMMPTLANTTEERNKLSSWSKLVGGFGSFVITTIGTSLIIPKIAPTGGILKAYFMIGITGGVMTLVFMTFPLAFNKEKYDIPNTSLSLKQVVDIFKSNDQLRAYSWILLLFRAASNIAIYQLFYLYVYCFENGADLFKSNFSYMMFWVIACTAQGLAMMFYNQLTKVISREKIYGLTFILNIIGYALMFSVFFILKPAGGNMKIYWLNTVLMALSATFVMLAGGLNNIGATVMISDVVDYGEWKTGKRGDTIVFSMQTFMTKLSLAIAMLILGVGISAAHLPTVQEVFDEATGAKLQQFVDSAGNIVDFTADPKSLLILRCFMFLIPIPITVIGYVIYKKKYNLYGERYDKIKAEIDENRRKVKSNG